MNITQNKKRRNLIVVSAAIVLLAIILLVKHRIQEIHNIPPQTLLPWALETTPVIEGVVTSGFPVLATVTTKGEITITAQTSGTIFKMGPREGVAVKKGAFLASIDTREIREQKASLQAKLEAAKADAKRQEDELTREEKLFDEGGSSATSLEGHRTATVAAKQNVTALKRQIAALEVREQYGKVTAPEDGVIAARLREPGDVCMPGHPIYRMTVSKGARVRVQLPQTVIEQIEPGAELELHHGSDTMTVTLSRVYPSLDAHALGAAEADLEVTPFGVPSGARVSGRVILQKRARALVVPPDALLSGADRTKAKVFKVVKANSKSTLKGVPVLVDLRGGSGVAVAGNLRPGDKVVVAHESMLVKLQNGDVVQSSIRNDGARNNGVNNGVTDGVNSGEEGAL